MKDNNIKRNCGSFWLGTLIGMAIGAALSLLYAPRSGVEMRAAIKEKAAETRDRATSKIDQAKSKIAELRGKSEKKAEEFESGAEGLA